MRKGLKKKVSIMAASCLAIACVSAGGATLVSVAETADPVLSMENGGAFYTVPGASVKIYEGVTVDGIDGNAMRFTFEMSEAQYASMIENGEYKNGASVSAYVIAEEKIDKGKTTAAQIATDTDAVKAAIPASKWQSSISIVEGSTAKVYYACAYVYDLPNSSVYDKNVSAFAIATQANNTTLYSSVQSRSMAYVADAALDSGQYVDKTTTLESYLPTYDVSFYGEDGEVIETKQVKYGTVAEAPDMTDTLQGEGTAARPQYEVKGWKVKEGDTWSETTITELGEITGATSYKVVLTEKDYTKNLMKYDEETGTYVYDGETPATSAQSQWYYLDGSGKSVYLDTTITTDGAAEYAQGTEGIIIKVGNVERRVLFANSGVYVFTENDGIYDTNAGTGAAAYTNSGLTDSEGNYAIYQSLTTFGKYFDTSVNQQTNNITPYGTWYGSSRYDSWGDISDCNRAVYIINDGYLYIALGGETAVTGFLSIDLNCMFNGLINDSTVYAIGYASSGTRYWNNNAPIGNGIVENPAYAYKTNELLFGEDAASMIAQAIANNFTERHAMMMNADGKIVNDGTLDVSSNYFYLAGSGKTVYLNTDIVTDGYQKSSSGGNAQSTEGIIIRVGETVRRVLFASTGVYVFTENDGTYNKSAGTGAAQYTNSGLTDKNGKYACYSSLAIFGAYYDVDMNQQTGITKTPYGIWYDGTIASQNNGYGRLNNGTVGGNTPTNVTYVIDGEYLYIALENKAFLKLDLNCLFYGLINENTVFEVGYASCGNWYGGGNTIKGGVKGDVWYSYETKALLYDGDATTKIAETLTLFNS